MIAGLPELLIVLGVGLAVWALGTERTLTLLEEIKTKVLKFQKIKRRLDGRYDWVKKLTSFFS